VQAAGAMSPKRTETTEHKLDIWTWGGKPGNNNGKNQNVTLRGLRQLQHWDYLQPVRALLLSFSFCEAVK